MAQSIYERSSLDEQCRRVIEKLDAAAQLHPRALEKELDRIQREVARLRDAIIDQLRGAEQSPVSGRAHSGLDGINVALSLIVGVEYPITSIQRSALEQARDTLKKLLADGSLSISPRDRALSAS